MEHLLNPEYYRKEMEQIIANYGLSPGNIYFVDKLPYKCSPYAPAQAHRIERKIYFKSVIDNDDIEAAVSKMISFGISEVKTIKLQSNRWLFLKHTLLHEICEILNPTWEDIERDMWAFKEMGI